VLALTLPPSTPQGPQDWNVPATAVASTAQHPQAQPQHGKPGGGPTSLWNFDDAAAKGMVDGLVGEDGVPPLTAPWAATHSVQA